MVGITSGNIITVTGDVTSQFRINEIATINTSSNANDGNYLITNIAPNGVNTDITVEHIDWDVTLTNGIDSGNCIASNLYSIFNSGAEKS
jgi:hypothetical protein